MGLRRNSYLLLADIRINNRNCKVAMQANKNGYFYVIDRTNGEFISASEMSQVSWATGIDPKTSRRNIHPGALYSEERVRRFIHCRRCED